MPVDRLTESDIHLLVTTFPLGNRDFCFFLRGPDDGWDPLRPISLLGLARADNLVLKLSQRQQGLGLVLALCRLLAPCLAYEGSGRHIVIEPWTADDLRGHSLPVDTRTLFSRQLAAEQAEDWRLIGEGQRPPTGSLAEVFWEAQTELPWLPQQFDDPELGHFAKALYQHLIPNGEGSQNVSAVELSKQILRCRSSDFTDLNLGIAPRDLHARFKKLLGVTLHWTSQLTGLVAQQIVEERLQADAESTRESLSPDELLILEFRYGTCRVLGGVNIAFFDGCGPFLGTLVNDLYRQYALGATPAERGTAELNLHKCLDLLRGYRRRRKHARAAERREHRQRRVHGPGKEPQPAAQEADPRAVPPDRAMEVREELEFLEKEVMPRLPKQDAKRLRALIEARNDRGEASQILGISREVFNRQWRQTTKPKVGRVIQMLRLDDEFRT